MRGARRFLRSTILVLAAVGLSGCSSFDWFADDEERLPGHRISVLTHQGQLSPDPEAEIQNIRLPRPFATPNWPQNGGLPSHTMHHVDLAASVKRAWSTDIGTGADADGRMTSPPVVQGKTVYVMDTEGRLSALATATGAVRWRRNLIPDDEDDGHFGGGVAIDQGVLFVTTGFGQVVSVRADSGKVRWRKQLPAPVRSAPTVHRNRVYVQTVDNRLVVLAGRDGEVLWEHEAFAETASLLGGASPAVAGRIVVAAFSTGEIVALNAENGSNDWAGYLSASRRTDPVATLADIRGNPAIDRGVVYAIGNSGIMSALDLESGKRLWTKEIAGLENPWIAGDFIYVLTREGDLICLGREKGQIYWVRSLPRYEDPDDFEDPIYWTGPVLAADRLIVAGTDGRALAVSPYDGKILGSLTLSDGTTVPPIVADRTLYVVTSDGRLSAYR